MTNDLETPQQFGPPSALPADADLPLFRFRLRPFLIFVTLASLLMAAMAVSQGMTALALLLAASVVGFHLFSTALGSQLRLHADRTSRYEPNRQFEAVPPLQPLRAQPRSPWHERHSPPLPWLPRFVMAAALVGGLLGTVALSSALGGRVSPAGIVVGSLSVAVVAGWFAFVGYSFFGVFRHGLRDAMAKDRHDG